MLLLEIANKTDYNLLRKQRDTLLDLIEKEGDECLTEEETSHFNGIVAFIDSFLEAVVEEGIKTEKEVFGASEGE